VGLHFNPAYMFIGDSGSDERDGRYSFTLGGSYPVGAPNYTRLILLWDVFVEQSHRKGESEILGAGAGLRYQLTYRSVLDFGVSSEFAGPEQRAPFSVRGGISIGF
jgi:hypothetical protein